MQILNSISEDSEYNFENELVDLQFNYILNHDNLSDDYNELKVFLKENINYIINNNIIELYEPFKDDNILIILKTFYTLLSLKINIIFKLKKWKEIYINDFFWNLSLKEQIEFMIQLKNYFLSIYDCSNGGSNFNIKLMLIFNKDNYNYKQIMNDIEDRLIRILDLFGPKIFEILKIPLIRVSEFYQLDNNQILKYLKVIFIEINKLLDENIELFNQFNNVNIGISKFLNIEQLCE